MTPIYYHVQSIRLLTSSISQIVMQACAGEYFSYQAGQYLKVLHEDYSESALSIACAPNELHSIELHLSHHAKNRKAQEVLQMARDNHALRVIAPYGECTPDRLMPGMPIIFLARGTGFASIKAVIEHLLKQQDEREIHLFWDAASEKKLYLLEVIQGWKKQFKHFRYTPVLSHAYEQHIVRDLIRKEYPDLSKRQIYASGAQQMIHAAYDYFKRHGLQPEHFYSDMLNL